MSEKQKFYLTTAIPYTSRKPHVGNTYELILADCIARYQKLQGKDVFFLTGTDEHGQKIETAARQENLSPKEYVDKITGELIGIWKKMNIGYDKFIRTTDEYHVSAVQKIFNKLYENGDIYKGEYEGWYCTPCESFWTGTQAEDGKCPDCGRPIELSKETAYFLRLSKYQARLEEHIENNPGFIVPAARKREMMNNFIKPGIQDLCVSRSTFTWGVPVEFDPGHVVYVWIDALSNYITALGYGVDQKGELYRKYWPAQLQIIGKDILRFHTIYWPIILMALGEELPETIFGHPWLLSGIDKMSKSRGNVMYADDLADLFGTDAVRYYVLAEMPFLQDGTITYEALIGKYNSDLANTLGNLVNRTAAMINQYFGGVIPGAKQGGEFDDDLIATINACSKKTTEYLDAYHVADAADEIMTILRRLNKYIDETTPWILGRDENARDRLSTVLYHLVEGLRIAATLLFPFIPESAQKIFAQLNAPDNEQRISITRWRDALVFGRAIPRGARVNPSPIPLFARIDEAEMFEKIARGQGARGEQKQTERRDRKPRDNQEQKNPDDQTPPEITIHEFSRVSLVAAKVVHCEPVEKSDKLLMLQLDDGEGIRQVVSGIAKRYSPERLIGKKVVLVANLKPAKLRGVDSFGMILAAGDDQNITVIFLDDEITQGTVIR